ncbi:MAG: MarR family winged helix-turn-helix transcriptional regulator [Oscillospiraceae bacterium]
MRIKMDSNRFEYIHKINNFITVLNALYHRASVKLGISDSVFVVLYEIFDEGDECLLTEIYKKSGISKQTVNSALRTLEKDGIVYLEKIDGRTKKVVLTEKGKVFVKNTVARIYQAEARAFDDWTDEEIKDYFARSEKYIRSFIEEIDKL